MQVSPFEPERLEKYNAQTNLSLIYGDLRAHKHKPTKQPPNQKTRAHKPRHNKELNFS